MTQHYTEEQLLKAAVDSIKAPSEDIARHVLLKAGFDPNLLQKGITTSTGLVAYDLQAPAKNLYPVQTPLRNVIKRVGGGIGTATNWKVVAGIIGSGFDAMGWVPEGQRSGTMSYATAPKAASFVTLGEEDFLTFEAINAGKGFEDVQATSKMRLLQKTMLKEENAILGGNSSLLLGTPVAPTLTAGGTGASLPAATYSVIVVALTYEGLMNSSLAGGIATQKTVTGADGATYTLNGGSSVKSAAATQAVTLGQTLFASVTPIRGALGYAWFVGTAGSETLQAITGINSAAFSAALAGSRQAASAVGGADYSANPGLAFDGLLTTALLPTNNAYLKVMAPGVAGTGTPLTSSGTGSVTEIDDMLQGMWDAYRLSPTLIYVNSQELRNISKKVLSSGSASLLNYFHPSSNGQPPQITAGSVIEFYYNPFTGTRIPIKVHPTLPAGTIIGWAADLPAQYQNNEVPNVAEMKTRAEYYGIDWPLSTRKRSHGVYVEEVLAVYAPFAMGVITNIANG